MPRPAADSEILTALASAELGALPQALGCLPCAIHKIQGGSKARCSDSGGLGRELYGQMEKPSYGAVVIFHGLVHLTKLETVPLWGSGYGDGEPRVPRR